MGDYKMTRRDAMCTSVATALPLLTCSSVVAGPGAAAKSPLTIGMATFGFHELTNRQLAAALAAVGVGTIQLFLSQSDSRYWKYNGRSDVSSLTPQPCRDIAEAYRSAGITIHSMGVYTNLIHPDEAEREANLAYFEAMMKVGDAMGVHTFITEAGHFHSDEPAPTVAYHFQEKVWYQMVETGKRLAKLAEKHQATVLFEPFFRGFLASAKRTRLFLQAIDSPRIRALLDPANLLEVDDLPEMFGQLGPWIECLHAKDRKLHVDRGVPAGKGDVNYRQFVKLAAEHTPKAPLIMEYVGSADYQQALAHLRGVLRKAR